MKGRASQPNATTRAALISGRFIFTKDLEDLLVVALGEKLSDVLHRCGFGALHQLFINLLFVSEKVQQFDFFVC